MWLASDTAKLHYKGKTYSFKSGSCVISKLPAGTVFGLSLGKNSDANRNAGLVGL
jgi:hypothetical protein